MYRSGNCYLRNANNYRACRGKRRRRYNGTRALVNIPYDVARCINILSQDVTYMCLIICITLFGANSDR